MLHLYAPRRGAVRVAPDGIYRRPPARDGFLGCGVLQLGDWQCVSCRVTASFAERFCSGGCPGPVAPAAQVLPGSDLDDWAAEP